MKFDAIDRLILEKIQTSSNITNSQLASDAGISPPAMLERVRRLEKNGVVKKCVALVDHEKMGCGTMVFVSITLARHGAEAVASFQDWAISMPEILESYHIAGDSDFLLKVVVKDIKQYEDFALKKLGKEKLIDRVRTTFVLSEMKYETKVEVTE